MGVGKSLWEWNASSLLKQHRRNHQHMKWLSGAGEVAAVETVAQGCCASGKLTPKSGQLHYMQSQKFRCISSLALFTNVMQESNMGVKQHRVTVTCNVQEYSYRVQALSCLMEDAADHSTSLSI